MFNEHTLMHSPDSHFRVCCTSTFSQSQSLLATFFWLYLHNQWEKALFFVFRHTLIHFEKSCFRIYILFMLTNFEYHPARFQITGIYKTTMFEKSIVYIMLSQNVQNSCIVCHPKILRAALYFAHLSNFKITTNTQISSKSWGYAPVIL